MKGFVLPYTYLIGWSSHHIYYYGCRYSKSSTPDDLWVSYFTSSKAVKQMRVLIGEPDIIQIRRVFNTKEAAILWESGVLRRIKATHRSDFLNKHDTPAPPINRMFGKANPQTDPVWYDVKSARGRERAQRLREAGMDIMGRPLVDPVIRTCPLCGSQKTYKTYRRSEVDIIKNRLCKSCAGSQRNLKRSSSGFYDRLKRPRIKS